MVEGRTCARCGRPLGPDPRAIYCRAACRRQAYEDRRRAEGLPISKGRGRRKPRSERFIAVDGEGIGDRLVLLADSTGRTIRRRSGLRTEEALDFLLEAPPGIKVAFGFDWDVNMILGDLAGPDGKPGPEARALWREGRCRWRGYEIHYVPRKIFRVRRGRERTTIYDLMSFFGCSFVAALERFGIDVPEIIREGKASRERFGSWTLDRIQRYNAAECEALAALAETLRERLQAAGLVPTRWHGPGAVATTWLRRVGATAWVAPGPEPVEEAARCAYFGGRIDVAGFGRCRARRYDLRSAYPAVLRDLPDLSKGRWRRVRPSAFSAALHPISLWYVRWSVDLGPGDWGPLPWRDDDGTVLWPAHGEGWYHGSEVRSAMDRFPGRIQVLDGWVYEDDGSRPWKDPIERLYRARESAKRREDPAEYGVKLVLNSLYGKAAQRRGRSPISSWILAGAITAGCRARINDAIGLVESRGGRVWSVMTDGVLTSLPIPTSRGLGGWSYEGRGEAWIAEPGLYEWDRSVYRRGYEVDASPPVREIVEAWIEGDPVEYPVTVRRFVGLGLAVEINGSYRWRTWVDADRTLSAVPLIGTTKRAPAWEAALRVGDFYLLEPYDRGAPRYGRPVPSGRISSAPYEPSILDQGERRRWLEDEAVPEDR